MPAATGTRRGIPGRRDRRRACQRLRLARKRSQTQKIMCFPESWIRVEQLLDWFRSPARACRRFLECNERRAKSAADHDGAIGASGNLSAVDAAREREPQVG